MRYGRFVALAVLALMVSACRFQADVNRFPSTTLPQDLSGKTFAFMPLDSQRGSAEYESHAALIAGYLEKQGWRRITDTKAADYMVAFSYGQSDGRQVNTEIPIWGQTGGGTSTTTGTATAYNPATMNTARGNYSSTTYTTPTYGVVGSHTLSKTHYTRYLDTQIYDWKRSLAENKLVGVWEAKATSVGESSSFATVSKCMVQAVFTEFRKSGSERVELQQAQCQ